MGVSCQARRYYTGVPYTGARLSTSVDFPPLHFLFLLIVCNMYAEAAVPLFTETTGVRRLWTQNRD